MKYKLNMWENDMHNIILCGDILDFHGGKNRFDDGTSET